MKVLQMDTSSYLIAKNEIGFKNLSKLVSISYLDNDNYNNPYVSFKL